LGPVGPQDDTFTTSVFVPSVSLISQSPGTRVAVMASFFFALDFFDTFGASSVTV
jgi:hypothetical protein